MWVLVVNILWGRHNSANCFCNFELKKKRFPNEYEKAHLKWVNSMPSSYSFLIRLSQPSFLCVVCNFWMSWCWTRLQILTGNYTGSFEGFRKSMAQVDKNNFFPKVLKYGTPIVNLYLSGCPFSWLSKIIPHETTCVRACVRARGVGVTREMACCLKLLSWEFLT